MTSPGDLSVKGAQTVCSVMELSAQLSDSCSVHTLLGEAQTGASARYY